MRDKQKENAYIKQRAKGKSIRRAAKAAGVAKATAFRAEYDPRVRSEMAIAIEEAAKRKGFKGAKAKIADTVIEALDATKVISANVIRKGETANDRDGMKDADESTKDFVDVPDYQARIKAAELAGKFRGDFVEKSEVELKGNMTIRIRSNVKG